MSTNEKKLAGEEAATYVETGMIVGLGTGSTVQYTIKKLAERISNEGLNIKGISTSSSTTKLAEDLGIPLVTLDEIDEIDLTIDGADEVDPDLSGIKGGGGALLFEKIVSHASKRNIWVVDAGKLVTRLGQFPLPVEVMPFGLRQVYSELSGCGFRPKVREKNGERYITDNGNLIIDLHLDQIEDPVRLEKKLNLIPGVVENGLFLGRTDIVIAGKESSTEKMVRPSSK